MWSQAKDKLCGKTPSSWILTELLVVFDFFLNLSRSFHFPIYKISNNTCQVYNKVK